MKRKDAQSQARSLLLRLGLNRPVEPARYARNLVARYGEIAEAALAEIDRKATGDASAAIYSKKNATLDLSLAIASQGFYPLYESVLTWIINEFPEPPRRILDLGCEAGVLSVAMAQLWPGAEVLGVDREPAAIRVARELQARHGVDRCQFLASEAEQLVKSEPRTFDLVIGVAVFHEMLANILNTGSEDVYGFTIDETPAWDHGQEELLRRLRSLVADGGCLVAVNRWTGPERTLQWVRSMESAGWSTDLDRSYLLEVNDRHAGDEEMPITVHRSVPNPVATEPDDVLALHAYPEFREREAFSFEGPAAEAMHRSFVQRQRIAGYELEYHDGSGIERIELFAAGPSAYLYNSSSRGYRRLLLGSLAFARDFAAAVFQFETRSNVGELRPLETQGNPERWEKYGIRFGEASVVTA
jgi:SAM-dependent methyltransferase